MSVWTQEWAKIQFHDHFLCCSNHSSSGMRGSFRRLPVFLIITPSFFQHFLPRSLGSSYWTIVLETKNWALSVFFDHGIFLGPLSRKPGNICKYTNTCTYISVSASIYLYLHKDHEFTLIMLIPIYHHRIHFILTTSRSLPLVRSNMALITHSILTCSFLVYTKSSVRIANPHPVRNAFLYISAFWLITLLSQNSSTLVVHPLNCKHIHSMPLKA